MASATNTSRATAAASHIGASPESIFRLDGRVAIVTGGSSGLGERFTRLLSGAGATVVTAARRLDRLDAVAGECERVFVERCDMTEPHDVQRLVCKTLDDHGALDVVVSNAGIVGSTFTPKLSVEGLRDVLDVNLIGAVQLAQLAGRAMAERGGGSLIHIASIHGLVATPLPGDLAYAVSKGGMLSLTRDLASTLAHAKVRVNAIAPGYFHSDMTDARDMNGGLSAYIRDRCPLGRLGRPEELDGILLFLASDASTYCTGQVIPIDGGWTAR